METRVDVSRTVGREASRGGVERLTARADDRLSQAFPGRGAEPTKVGRVSARSVGWRGAEISARPMTDRVELSIVGEPKATSAAGIRADLVRAARERIAAGEYDRPEVLDAAIENLLNRVQR